MNIDILTAEQVRGLDAEAIKRGVSANELMENAGKGLALELMKRQPGIKNKSVIIFTGKGNNGGDGFVAARHLDKSGANVEVVLLAGDKEIKGEALTSYKRAKKIEGIKFSDGLRATIEEIKGKITGSEIIVDAIFGTGLSGKISGRIMEVIKLINDSGVFTVACDIPSGVNGDTGAVDGDMAVEADLTVTFGYPKKGMFIYPGSVYTGSVEVVDIGLLTKDNGSTLKLITAESVRRPFAERKKNAHKGDFGHVLVLAGSRGFTGAAALTCMAAMRSGAGLVTLGIPEGLNNVLEEKLTEPMTLPLPETAGGSLSYSAYENIIYFINSRKPDMLAIGPGLGQDPDTAKLVRALVNDVCLPCILDADGINAFKTYSAELKKAKAGLILTPHPGELSRLIDKDIDYINKNRIEAAMEFSRRHSVMCVLKGYQTVVCSGSHSYINTTGNPGMACGGTGDVLTGIMAGLFCQVGQQYMLEAINAGVFLHGLAGDIAAKKKTLMGLIATDIIEALPESIMQLNKRA